MAGESADNRSVMGGSGEPVDAAAAFVSADVFYSELNESTDLEEDDPIEESETGDADSADTDDSRESEEESVEAGDDSEYGDGEKEQEVDDKHSTAKYSFDEDSGYYEFKSNGKTVKANIDKLIENFSKGEGFTKKTMDLANRERDRAQAHTKALAALKAQEDELIALTESVNGLLEEGEIDWDDLRDNDASAYLREKERIKERQAKIKEAREKVQLRQNEELKTRAGEEFKKLTALMGWDTQEKVTEGFNKISDYCVSIGMEADDIKSIYSHKIYKALSDASKYAALEKAKEKTVKQVKKAPKSVKSKVPGKPAAKKSAIEVLYGS